MLAPTMAGLHDMAGKIDELSPAEHGFSKFGVHNLSRNK